MYSEIYTNDQNRTSKNDDVFVLKDGNGIFYNCPLCNGKAHGEALQYNDNGGLMSRVVYNNGLVSEMYSYDDKGNVEEKLSRPQEITDEKWEPNITNMAGFGFINGLYLYFKIDGVKTLIKIIRAINDCSM